MKVKQVYVANDGREFNTEDQCLSYEKSVSHADKYKSISALWNTREGLNTTSFIQDNYDKIKAIMEPVESKDIQQVDWSKVPKGTKINFPVLKGKPKMNKAEEKFSKSEIDYLKDKMSSIIQFHEWSMKEHKTRAERLKKGQHESTSKAEFSTVGKMQKELKKLAEIQRKIKRMR